MVLWGSWLAVAVDVQSRRATKEIYNCSQIQQHIANTLVPVSLSSVVSKKDDLSLSIAIKVALWALGRIMMVSTQEKDKKKILSSASLPLHQQLIQMRLRTSIWQTLKASFQRPPLSCHGCHRRRRRHINGTFATGNGGGGWFEAGRKRLESIATKLPRPFTIHPMLATDIKIFR